MSNIQKMKRYSLKLGLLLAIVLPCMLANPASAQHTFNNSVSQYYRDGFLWNPAMAGESGTRLYGLYNSAWSGFDGSASQATVSGDIDFGNSMGAGINLSSHKAGAFNEFAGELGYAYRVRLNDNANLRIGGGLSFYKQHLDTKYVTAGGQVDPVAESFNEKGVQFNGDLGVNYRTGGFNLGGTAYNLGAYFQQRQARESDLEIFEALSSYRFTLSNPKLSIEPLAAYKMFYQSDNIFLVAGQFEYQDLFHTSIYWESTGSVMGGLGFMLSRWGELNFFYTSKNKYGYHEQYEAGIKILLQ